MRRAGEWRALMDLLPFFEWAAATSLGQAISTSTWAFAVIESGHLLALAVIGGAVLIVDLRLLGFGLKNQPIAQIARDTQPWLVGSLIMMIATGILLFVSEPMKLYYSTSFAVKMTCLALVIVFTFTVRASCRWRCGSESAPVGGGSGFRYKRQKPQRMLRTLISAISAISAVQRRVFRCVSFS
jgi:hypothetical protein